jgi:hypothetical protein
MFVAEQKYSRGRTRRAGLRLVLLLICLMAFRPGMDDTAMNLTQVSLADMVVGQSGETGEIVAMKE